MKRVSSHRARSGRLATWFLPAGILAAAGLTGGCVVHVHDHEDAPRERVVVREEAPPPQGTYQPAPGYAPPQETAVYEPAPYTPPPPEVTTVYEQELSPYGEWVVVGNYGRCWRPFRRHEGWRPYSVGHWATTDQGWCWVSEEDETSWGPVAYHYGRWYDDSSAGWVWVPGSVWAPSWCAWREGNGYCGWAPLPPACGDNVVVNVAVADQYCPRESYSYVDERYMGEPRIHDHIERNNVTIINRTTNITNITYVNNGVSNRGVKLGHVEQRLGHKLEVTRIARVESSEEAQRAVREGRPTIYAPPAIVHYQQEHPPRGKALVRTTRQPLDEKTRLEQSAQERARVNPGPAEPGRMADLERQRADQQRAARENERAAQQRAVDDRAGRERTAAEQAAQERAALQRTAAQRAEEERTAAQRSAQERANAERANHPAADEKMKLEQQNKERVDGERAAQQRTAAEQRAAAERAGQERAAAERAAQERTTQERAVGEQRAAAERAAQERGAQERAVGAQRAAAERAAQERAAQEHAVGEQRAAAERAAQERAAQERAAQERAVGEQRAAAERAAQERAAQERAAQERAAQERGSGQRTPPPPAKDPRNPRNPNDNSGQNPNPH